MVAFPPYISQNFCTKNKKDTLVSAWIIHGFCRWLGQGKRLMIFGWFLDGVSPGLSSIKTNTNGSFDLDLVQGGARFLLRGADKDLMYQELRQTRRWSV